MDIAGQLLLLYVSPPQLRFLERTLAVSITQRPVGESAEMCPECMPSSWWAGPFSSDTKTEVHPEVQNACRSKAVTSLHECPDGNGLLSSFYS